MARIGRDLFSFFRDEKWLSTVNAAKVKCFYTRWIQRKEKLTYARHDIEEARNEETYESESLLGIKLCSYNTVSDNHIFSRKIE